ncbi:MAG: 15-cis-phytoene synthase, partial [Alphaproteobacteria bacterium]|nr:15-cis-phytoene synthase [Alphaproteobacteria bacterium]
MQDAYDHCEALVREADKDRFLASLFAPANRRRHLFALYGFNVEIARVGQVAHEPLAGENRQQWWRDALSGVAPGEAAANPVAAALLDTIARCGLPAAPLDALIDARTRDLYDDPILTLSEL